jgi:hypothetical protein
MQERAFELQSESEAEEAEHEPVDLGAVRARTLVAVGELDKPDFHEIAGRLRDGIEGAEGAGVEAAAISPRWSVPKRPLGWCGPSSSARLYARRLLATVVG